MKIDKVRAHREELKRLLFSIPTEGRKVTKTITVTMIKGINGKPNQWWPGYGNVAFDSDGPDGFCEWKSCQSNPMEHALTSEEYLSGDYELIIK